MNQICYAHSASNKDYADWQTMQSHARNVGNWAARFASSFGAQVIADYMGRLHDLGKYTQEFNARLHGGPSVDHATAGAKIAYERWQTIGKLMAFCIAGHHAGLANGAGEGSNRRTLQQRLALQFGKDIPALDTVWQQEIALPDSLPEPPLKPDAHHPFFSYAFFTRMLYSCLVDADFLDTEAFYAKLENKSIQRGTYPDLSTLQQNFNDFIEHFRQASRKTQPLSEAEKRQVALNKLRNEILDHSISQAKKEAGLFTLTVPTGGGKTFTSMAFALEHAKQHGMQRVIYVIPFTSIIEQNAAEFRKAFGALGERAVLEHHSTFDDRKLKDQSSKDKLRLASENWDAPVIVTTAVQFFESLFADRSSPCRKLHNIANSVIILDEAQMLPLNLLRPIMQAIKELAQNYHCSVVMCTATQPALQAKQQFYQGFDNVREIAPNPENLFIQLQRTQVRYVGIQTDEKLQQKLTALSQILIIVNNRRHARSLYDQAKSLDGVFLLTTLLCAKHRSQALSEIRRRLKAGEPCRVIATSLIEAGVDVDFPFVMRAEAGLDSVAQAAGRCNREGKKLAQESQVWVFQAEEQWKTPAELAIQAAVMRLIAQTHENDLLSLDAMSDYFTELYQLKGQELDYHQILSLHHKAGKTLDFPFQDIAEKFRLIESHISPILIPFDKRAERWIRCLSRAKQVSKILRKLQPYIVQIPQNALIALHKAKRIELINQTAFGEQFYVLIGLDLYDDVVGISWGGCG